MTNNNGILYIVQGFIAAGKSTFSKKLKIDTNSIHINPDEWVSKLYKEDEYMSNWNECFDATVNKLWIDTEEYLKDGKSVIFDMGFWKRKDRDYARNVANKCNAKCVHYYLFVPDEILKKRIISTRPEKWAKIHIENFNKNKSMFEKPSSDEEIIKINNYKDIELLEALNKDLEYKAKIIGEENINELYELCKSNEKYYSYLKEDLTMDGVKSILTDLPPNVTIDNKYVIGFYSENNLVGVMDLINNYPSNNKSFIGLFMLDKNVQGKGIGKYIIGKILNLYKSMDYESCHIGVIDSNIEAINFWEKIGFNENGTIYTHDKYNVIMMDFIL